MSIYSTSIFYHKSYLKLKGRGFPFIFWTGLNLFGECVVGIGFTGIVIYEQRKNHTRIYILVVIKFGRMTFPGLETKEFLVFGGIP